MKNLSSPTGPLHWKAGSILNHWATREVPMFVFLYSKFLDIGLLDQNKGI